MKQTYMIIAGASFIAMFLAGIWPRACLDKAKRMLEAKGEDPHQQFGFAEIKKLDPKLSRQYRTGLAISIVCGVAFAVFVMLALHSK